MRHFRKRLAVALNTAMLLTLSVGACSVEREDDGSGDGDEAADLGTCTCEVKAVIWVNSAQGGTVTCNGQTWQYTQGVRVYPICMDSQGEGFVVHVVATGETWIEGFVIEEGPDDMPAYFDFDWGLETPAPEGFPAAGSLASEVYLPNGGTLDAVVPEAQPTE